VSLVTGADDSFLTTSKNKLAFIVKVNYSVLQENLNMNSMEILKFIPVKSNQVLITKIGMQSLILLYKYGGPQINK
jgi:hypothetical protein